MLGEFIFFQLSSVIKPLVFILLLLFLAGVFIWRKKRGGNGFYSSTPVLDSFSSDLTLAAQKNKLDPVVGRKMEIDQLAVILSRRTKNNSILVGSAGVGKTAVVEGLAERIINEAVPFDLRSKRVLALDLNAILAGTKYRGEFEDRMKKLIAEIEGSKRTIIIFIDEIHNLMVMESGGETISVGDILKPAMARGDLQIIGATTPTEYKKYFENDPAFERRLQPLFINEPNEKETLEILKGIKEKYEEYHHVIIPDEILQLCITQSRKILLDRSYPDKAIDLMDESASNAKIIFNKQINAGHKVGSQQVSPNDVYAVAQKYSR